MEILELLTSIKTLLSRNSLPIVKNNLIKKKRNIKENDERKRKINHRKWNIV